MLTDDNLRDIADELAAELGERNKRDALAEYQRLLADPTLAHVDAGELARQVRVRRGIKLATWREWTAGQRGTRPSQAPAE